MMVLCTCSSFGCFYMHFHVISLIFLQKTVLCSDLAKLTSINYLNAFLQSVDRDEKSM